MTSVSAKHFVDWRPTVASLIPPVGGTLFPTSNCFPQTALLRDWGNGKPETTLRIYPIAQKSVAFAVRALSNQESTQSLTQCDPTAIKYRDHSHTTNDGLPFILLPLKPTYRKRDLGAANGDLGTEKTGFGTPEMAFGRDLRIGPNFAWNSDCRALSLQ